MDLKILGMVRGLFAPNYPESDEDKQFAMNTRGEQLVSQGLPELVEIVRLGFSWQVSSTTGQAALTALPTTTAGLTIRNNDPAGGVTLVIDSFGSVEEVIDATQTDVTALFAMLNARGDTAPSAGTAETAIKSLSGRGAGGTGSALVSRGMTVTNNGWFPHGTPGAQMAPVAGGANWKVNEALVRGMYLVPPGGAFSIQAVKAAAAAAAQQFFFFRWHEVQLIVKP